MTYVATYSQVIPTRIIITGHTATGIQLMSFRYFTANGGAGNAPFAVYNPNGTDDARLGQTKSVYTVMEIEP